MKEIDYLNLKHKIEIIDPIRFEPNIPKKIKNRILHRMLKAEELLEKRQTRFTYNPRCVIDDALNFKDDPEFLVVSNPFTPYALIAGSMTFEQVVKEREKIYQKNPYSVSIMLSVKDFMNQAVFNNKIQHLYNEVNFPIKNPLLTIDFTYPFIKEFKDVIKNYKIDNSAIVRFNFNPLTINSLTCSAKMPFLTSLQVLDIYRNEIVLPPNLYKLSPENKIGRIINPVPDWSNQYGVNINIDNHGWVVEKSI